MAKAYLTEKCESLSSVNIKQTYNKQTTKSLNFQKQ